MAADVTEKVYSWALIGVPLAIMGAYLTVLGIDYKNRVNKAQPEIENITNDSKRELDIINEMLKSSHAGAGEIEKQEEPLRETLRESDFGSGHVIGTTVMGAERSGSVVDSECRSHDFHKLFILGNSVFPTASAANPTLTIAALSLRVAEAIRRQLTGR